MEQSVPISSNAFWGPPFLKKGPLKLQKGAHLGPQLSRNQIDDVNTYNRRSAIKPHEQATLFNIHFHSVFCKQSTGVPAPIQTDLQDPSFEVVTNHVTCDTREVQKLLSCLNANKSCGVDKNTCSFT